MIKIKDIIAVVLGLGICFIVLFGDKVFFKDDALVSVNPSVVSNKQSANNDIIVKKDISTIFVKSPFISRKDMIKNSSIPSLLSPNDFPEVPLPPSRLDNGIDLDDIRVIGLFYGNDHKDIRYAVLKHDNEQFVVADGMVTKWGKVSITNNSVLLNGKKVQFVTSLGGNKL